MAGQGVIRGAAVVFFAYIGFSTAVSATAQEAKNTAARYADRNSWLACHLYRPLRRPLVFGADRDRTVRPLERARSDCGLASMPQGSDGCRRSSSSASCSG